MFFLPRLIEFHITLLIEYISLFQIKKKKSRVKDHECFYFIKEKMSATQHRGMKKGYK